MSEISKLGIHIQDLDLSKVTGVVGISLIIPKPGVVAPILLLFGEHHEEINYGCENINYKEQFNKIFEKLNNIALNDNFNIDFYIETFLNKRLSDDIKNKDNFNLNTVIDHNNYVGLLGYIKENYNFCFYNELRKKNQALFSEKCNYPNIKWQFSDIRKLFYKGKFGINNMDLVENNVCNMIVFLSTLSHFYNDKYPDHLEKRKLKIEKEISKNKDINIPFMQKIVNQKKEELARISQNNINHTITDFFSTLGINKGNPKQQFIAVSQGLDFEEDIDFITFIGMLKDNTLFYDKNFDVMADKIINTELINKQIKDPFLKTNIKGDLIKYLSYWNDRVSTSNVFKKVNFYVINLLKIIIDFLENIDDDINISYDTVYSDRMHSKFSKIIEFINTYNIDDYINNSDDIDIFYGGSLDHPPDFYADKNFKELSKIISLQVFIKQNSIMLDIYFILRISKYKINQPTLIAKLVGNAHKTNIAEYFKLNMEDEYDVYNFKKISRENYTPLSQCVDTTNNVTNIYNEKIDNFYVDIYDLLIEQGRLISEQNIHHSIDETPISNLPEENIVESTLTEIGGYKKSKTKKKSIRRKYQKQTYKKKCGKKKCKKKSIKNKKNKKNNYKYN